MIFQSSLKVNYVLGETPLSLKKNISYFKYRSRENKKHFVLVNFSMIFQSSLKVDHVHGEAPLPIENEHFMFLM